MRVTLVYELPDELEAYKQALKVKNQPSTPCPATTEYRRGMLELHAAIMQYMLQPDKHETLMHLNKTLDKYSP